MSVPNTGHFGIAEWVSLGAGLVGLLCVMAICPADRRRELAFGAFLTGASVGMFLVMMWGIALDKELFVKTISGSGVSVFGALLYSAMLSLWSLWEMRDKPRRYSRLG